VGVNKKTGRRIKVAFFKPEDDEAKTDPRPKIHKSAKECWDLISTNEDARRTLQKLVDAGCDWVQLLGCVNGFCEHYELPGEMWNAAFTQTLRSTSKKVAGFEKKIARWEENIRRFNAEITDLTHVDLAPPCTRL
jgi:hypothetical protein